MSDQPEKLDLHSASITDLQKAKLRELFPEVFTEGSKIDFDRLKRTLGESVDAGKERFGLTWPGKADCFNTIQRTSLATLRPARDESVDFNSTKNLLIEGDNLEVLRLLQKSYIGKVKMIYIDPPYNTGNDFIYPDNYAESLDTYIEYTGQADAHGRKFGNNTETDGRFHSRWLNMMFPRLFLARNILAKEGAIFISIDEKEYSHLRFICGEIFGEENLIGTVVWKNATDNNPTNVAVEHEYILVVAKDKDALENEWKSSVSDIKSVLVRIGQELTTLHKGEALSAAYEKWFREHKAELWPLDRYKYIDSGGIYTGSQSVHNPGKEGYRYDVIHPTTKKPCKQPLMGYRFPKSTMENLIQDGRILFGEDEDKIIELKVYASEFQEKLSSVLELDGRLGSYDLKEDFPEEAKVFNNPKPIRLLTTFLPFLLKQDGDMVLDFFAGSGATGRAVYELNAKDSIRRSYCLIQLPEPLSVDVPSQKFGAEFCDKLGKPKNIAEITKERLRRAGIRIREQNPLFAGDLGFKVFRLDRSGFKAWQGEVARDSSALGQQLDLQVEHIVTGRSDEDILAELLLKSGFSLSTPVEILMLAEKPVYSVEQGAMLICLDRQLTPEVIQAIASRAPVRVLCLDAGFAGNDQLKTNAVQQMRSAGVTKFMTV